MECATLFGPHPRSLVATAVPSLFIDDLEGAPGEIIERRLADANTPDAWIQMRFLGGARPSHRRQAAL